MKKYLLTILTSLLVGFFLSNYIIKMYGEASISIPTFNQSETIYLIQQGVYSSYESMQSNTSNISDYIYSNIDGMFYVYIAMTMDLDNVTKLQTYYEEKGINTIVKTTTTTDYEFITSLNQYDTILKQTNDNQTIKEICKLVLSKYKEV